MSYQKYDAYKDSGVLWLGEIPEHWKIYSNKYLMKLKKSAVGKKAHQYKLLSLTLNGIIARDMENPKGKFPAEFDTYQEVKKDELVFCLFDIEETPRTVGYSDMEGMITGAYTVFKCNPVLHSKYMYYYYLSLDEKKRLKPLYSGLRNVIQKDTFMSIKSPLPPLEEQKAIAEFIDKKTSQIDTHIDKQERLIALLKERRTAIINKAVTRGLDENVKLKESGIDLLGEIPKHWEVKKLKYISKITLGKMLCNDNKGGYQLKPYLKSKNIGWLKPVTEAVDYMWFSQKEMKLYCLKKDDLLVSEGGEVGKTCIWDNELEECYIQNSVHKVTIHSTFLPHFYLYYFYALGKQEFFKSIVNQVSIGHLTKDKLSNIVCICPPKQEQKEIVGYIEKENIKINTSIVIIEKEIASLKEYRQSLISNAVTGKIRVI